MSHLHIYCTATGAEWDFDDEVQACVEGGHEHVPVEQNGRSLNLNERLADTPQ